MGLTRRSLLLGLTGAPFLARALEAQEADVRVSDVLTRAKNRGMKGFEVTESKRFIGIGDASKEFRKEAIDICEEVAAAYMEHFKVRKFPLLEPQKKMLAVIFQGPSSYEQFLNQKLVGAVGGMYNITLNVLFMFDFRARNSPEATRTNTMALVHETTHQLTYNTGVLYREADVPLAIAEGLASYAEVWRPKNKSKIGQINRGRIDWLTGATGVMQRWIPLETLITEDNVFRQENRQQAAYAQGWALMHYFLKNPAETPKLINWIRAVNTRKDEAKRLDDARAHLGDLEKLDKQLKIYIRRPTVS